MAFEVSQVIEDYISARSQVFLKACPGSGKTTTVAYKLSVLAENWEDAFGRFSGIACLSFTNIAKDEISEKYVEFSKIPLGFPHLVSTIDSFINRYITLPFFYLFQPDAKRPRIVEDGSVINSAWQRSRLGQEFRNKKNQPIHYSYSPHSIHVELDGSFSYEGHQPNPEKVDVDTFNEYCKTLKRWQIRERGILTINDSAFVASYLLEKYPRIASWLAKRFPIIIVDEAQDTSEVQFSILERIADAGLESLELVGDPYQCLYEWRNAQPDLLVERIQDASDWITLELNDNRRSHSKITKCFSVLRTEGEPEVKPVTQFDVEYPILVVKYSKDNEFEAVEKFYSKCNVLEDNHVVVRGRSLRNKLYGNTYPEKSLWNSPLPEALIAVKKSFEVSEIKKAVSRLRSLTPTVLEPNCDLSRRLEIEDELRDDYEARALLFYIGRNLPSFDLTVEDWTRETGRFLLEALATKLDVPNSIDFGLKKGKYKKLYSQRVKDIYGEQASTLVPISTIHQVKGMTFDSLLLILSPTSRGASISINDIRKPERFPPEKQRMIYVAMSRPRYLLSIGVPETTPDSLVHQKLGDDIEII